MISIAVCSGSPHSSEYCHVFLFVCFFCNDLFGDVSHNTCSMGFTEHPFLGFDSYILL